MFPTDYRPVTLNDCTTLKTSGSTCTSKLYIQLNIKYIYACRKLQYFLF